MLSTGAFNALLKTLEEPPEHVKFILATTEPQKLPATILSRCQRFDFKRISNQDVIKRLKIICKESNIKITDDALRIIAVLSEGAMRDAISILERCIGEQKGLIDGNIVRDLVGIPKTTQIYSIVKSIVNSNIDEVINNTKSIIDEGKDIDNFLWEIIKYIKDILVYKSSKNLDIYNEEEIKQINELAQKVSKEKLLHLIYELSELSSTIKWSSQKTIMFEAGMIKACINLEVKKITEDTYDNPNNIKKSEAGTNTKNLEINNVNLKKNEGTMNKEKINNMDEKKTNLQHDRSAEKPSNIVSNKENLSYWNNVINMIKQRGKMGIYVNLIGSTAKEINDMTIEVEIANKNAFAKNILETHENKAEIERIASIEAGKTINIKFVSAEDKKKDKLKTNSIENMITGLDIPINIIDE